MWCHVWAGLLFLDSAVRAEWIDNNYFLVPLKLIFGTQ